MNPISLLTKGHTIRALKERPGRYKLLSSGTLPRFSGAKNEIPTMPHTTAPSEQTALFEQPKPVEAVKVEVKSSLAEKSPFARAALEKRKVQPVAQADAAPTQPQSAKLNWLRQLTVFSAAWMNTWIPKRKAMPSQQATFQTELALDKIKVLRNDFSEDDLEVVLIEKKAGSGPRKPAQDERVELEELAARS
jgi:hypothetical protein